MKRSIAVSSSATDLNTPRLSRRLVSLAKKPSTALSQDAEVGVKWKGQREGETFVGLRVLLGGVIVDDRVDRLSPGDLRVDRVEEADEVLMAMMLHVAADDGSIEDVE